MCYQLLGKERGNILFPSGPLRSSMQGRNDVHSMCKQQKRASVVWGVRRATPGLVTQGTVGIDEAAVEEGSARPDCLPGQLSQVSGVGRVTGPSWSGVGHGQGVRTAGSAQYAMTQGITQETSVCWEKANWLSWQWDASVKKSGSGFGVKKSSTEPGHLR